MYSYTRTTVDTLSTNIGKLNTLYNSTLKFQIVAGEEEALQWKPLIFNLIHEVCHLGGFPGGTSSKEPTCQCRRNKRRKFNPWVRKSPGVGHGNPLPYSCLENPMDRGAWRTTVHGVTKSRTWLKWLSMHFSSVQSLWLGTGLLFLVQF